VARFDARLKAGRGRSPARSASRAISLDGPVTSEESSCIPVVGVVPSISLQGKQCTIRPSSLPARPFPAGRGSASQHNRHWASVVDESSGSCRGVDAWREPGPFLLLPKPAGGRSSARSRCRTSSKAGGSESWACAHLQAETTQTGSCGAGHVPSAMLTTIEVLPIAGPSGTIDQVTCAAVPGYSRRGRRSSPECPQPRCPSERLSISLKVLVRISAGGVSLYIGMVFSLADRGRYLLLRLSNRAPGSIGLVLNQSRAGSPHCRADQPAA